MVLQTVSRRTRMMAVAMLALALMGTGGGFSPARSGTEAIPRAFKDRPDQLSRWQIHAIYFVPRGTRDGRLDVNGTLGAAARRMQAWFSAASGGYRWRLDTFGAKRFLDVTFVRGARTNGEYRAQALSPAAAVSEELRERGMTVAETRKRYLVFYAGDTSDDGLCGIADYPIYGPRQYTPARDPGVMLGGNFAFVFLGAAPGCHPDDFGQGREPGWVQSTMMHELTHTEGLSPPGAPHTCDPTFLLGAGHVCGLGAASLAASTATEPVDPERADLMFPFINMALGSKLLDQGRDDYFSTQFGTLDLTRSAFVDPPDGSANRRLSRGVVFPAAIHLHPDLPGIEPHTHSD